MTRRDLKWRMLGSAMLATGFAVGAATLVNGSTTMVAIELAAFVLAIAGLVMLVQGKRVPMAFRIERSRHRYLPNLIAARRRRR